jgi:excisionase family DNA binding protein
MGTADVPGCLPVNRRTIYRLIKSGNLPAVRIGGQWRFRRSDLNAWIDRRAPPSTSKLGSPPLG